jgi:hypothetical protein
MPQFWNTHQDAVAALRAAVLKYTAECGKPYNEFTPVENDNPFIALIIHFA